MRYPPACEFSITSSGSPGLHSFNLVLCPLCCTTMHISYTQLWIMEVGSLITSGAPKVRKAGWAVPKGEVEAKTGEISSRDSPAFSSSDPVALAHRPVVGQLFSGCTFCPLCACARMNSLTCAPCQTPSCLVCLPSLPLECG